MRVCVCVGMYVFICMYIYVCMHACVHKNKQHNVTIKTIYWSPEKFTHTLLKYTNRHAFVKHKFSVRRNIFGIYIYNMQHEYIYI